MSKEELIDYAIKGEHMERVLDRILIPNLFHASRMDCLRKDRIKRENDSIIKQRKTFKRNHKRLLNKRETE